ncbi:MAG: hypothetical protein AAFZ15_22990 [Bacteroidota bacterium]
MKNIIFLTAFFIPFLATAQLKFSGYASQQIGVEHNPFNNPSSYVFDKPEDEEEGFLELTPTSVLSRSKIYIHVRQKDKNATFGLRPKLTYDYFPSLENTNHLRGALEQYFNFKINKKWKMYERFSFVTNQRSGDAVDEDIFIIPRSYERWQGGMGAIFKINRTWSVDVGANFLKNNFLTEDELNYYKAFSVEGKLQGKFKKSNVVRRMEISSEWQQRNWFRGMEGEEDWEETATSMQYWQARWSADIMATEKLEWSPFLKAAGRNSERTSQNWWSLQAGFSTSWSTEDVSLKWSTSVAHRLHPDLKPANNEALKYVYFRNKITAEYLLKENWSLLLIVQHTQRFSSFKEETSMAFRSYRNAYAGLGLKVRF